MNVKLPYQIPIDLIRWATTEIEAGMEFIAHKRTIAINKVKEQKYWHCSYLHNC